MSILIKSLIQTAVFMICARAMVQLRPKGDYEKYLKLLVSLMILSQITFALTGLWKGGGEQEKQLEALEQQLSESLSKAGSLTGEAQRKVEELTMGQIREALAQEEKKKQEEEKSEGQNTESEQGDAKTQGAAQKQEGQEMTANKEKAEEQNLEEKQLPEVQMAEEQAAKQEEIPLQKQSQTEQQSKNKEKQTRITIKIEPIKVGEEP